MQNQNTVNKLIDIKRQIAELGVEYLETKMPVALSEVGLTLKPFTNIDQTIDQAIKKFSSDIIPGSIPKLNSLQS